MIRYANSMEGFIPIFDLGYLVMCNIGINYPNWWLFASRKQIGRYLEYAKVGGYI